ncbi:hypothetical protein [Mycobacterium tuberculosis]|uniref:Lipoprotein n=4 Tax=Veracruzvirus heldan TaxID=1032892 RepID=A0A8F3E7M2_9CAUD|nr:hypothetical protein [Mycobacterium tuberculosis]YP_009637657.1 hypothetical protein FGG19_gp65 [Mycobacterium phage HelDan]ASW31290.1 hypothetical protein SEA_FRED313_32 [Mycobacterium phage Fred313]QDP44312.1 lipoprotein [Mycobacterium phage Heathen]QWY79573.1 lipoprotein [Mycobacterium phage Scout]AEJ92082.1 hypothetical protein HELDAN_32 [Mycobacterium phage HelDan]MBP2972684.1 hypothetical protein [Mycobacterium tuberculosis]
MHKLALTLTAAAVLLAGCSQEAPSAAPTAPAAKEEAKRGTVVFEIGGNYSYATYDDNFENGIEYPPGVTRIELHGEDVPQPPKGLYTWANTSEGRDSEAWCKITVDGQVVAQDRRTGEANDPMCMYYDDKGQVDLP